MQTVSDVSYVLTTVHNHPVTTMNKLDAKCFLPLMSKQTCNTHTQTHKPYVLTVEKSRSNPVHRNRHCKAHMQSMNMIQVYKTSKKLCASKTFLNTNTHMHSHTYTEIHLFPPEAEPVRGA